MIFRLNLFVASELFVFGAVGAGLLDAMCAYERVFVCALFFHDYADN